MAESRVKASIIRILWTDYIAFWLFLLPIVAWVVYVAWTPDWRGEGPVIPPWMAPLYLDLAILTLVISLVGVSWRIILIQAIFRRGSVTPGRISSLEFHRDRCKVEVSFAYHGETLSNRTTLHRNGQTRILKEGERVVLLVDPKKPRRALIRHLYI